MKGLRAWWVELLGQRRGGACLARTCVKYQARELALTHLNLPACDDNPRERCPKRVAQQLVMKLRTVVLKVRTLSVSIACSFCAESSRER